MVAMMPSAPLSLHRAGLGVGGRGRGQSNRAGRPHGTAGRAAGARACLSRDRGQHRHGVHPHKTE